MSDTVQIARCRWCGDQHPVEALCTRARRGLSRRSFLFLGGAAAVGFVLQPEIVIAQPQTAWQFSVVEGSFSAVSPNIGQLVADAWNKVIGEAPNDNIFNNGFRELMRAELSKELLK